MDPQSADSALHIHTQNCNLLHSFLYLNIVVTPETLECVHGLDVVNCIGGLLPTDSSENPQNPLVTQTENAVNVKYQTVYTSSWNGI